MCVRVIIRHNLSDGALMYLPNADEIERNQIPYVRLLRMMSQVIFRNIVVDISLAFRPKIALLESMGLNSTDVLGM